MKEREERKKNKENRKLLSKIGRPSQTSGLLGLKQSSSLKE